jgi:hypothetical protein
MDDEVEEEWVEKLREGGSSEQISMASLETAIGRHQRVEFGWVKAHSGILLNEIADTLATRGVNGTTYCPTDWFDELPDDTEQEDDPIIPDTEMITQTEELADDIHQPPFGTRAQVYGLNANEAAEVAEAAEEAARAEQEAELERSIRHFLHDTCDNSSTPVTDDEDVSNTGGVILVGPGMTVDDGSDITESPKEPEFHIQAGHVGEVDLPESMAPSPWSSTRGQARAEAAQRRDAEERFSWMKEADLQMLSMGLEPVPREQFADAISQS